MQDWFETIYKDTYDVVLRNTLRYANGDLYLAEDAILYAYEKLWETISMDGVVLQIQAWLVQVGKNYIFSEQRKRNRIQLEEDVCQKIELSEDSTEEAYLRQVEEEQLYELFYQILNALKKKNESWYEVVYQVYVLERTITDTAICLDIHSEAVRSRLRRAKKWMKKEYHTEYEFQIINQRKEVDSIQGATSFF